MLLNISTLFNIELYFSSHFSLNLTPYGSGFDVLYPLPQFFSKHNNKIIPLKIDNICARYCLGTLLLTEGIKVGTY